MPLDDERFLAIVESTPLVSIDLVVRDPRGRVLLGERTNRPAQGFWFVPGGRIKKGERLPDALARIAEAELGLIASPGEARFLGVYEHIYDDNYLGREGVGTHYVVLAHELAAGNDFEVRADDQHSEIRWWTIDELLAHPDVHDNTKAYFR